MAQRLRHGALQRHSVGKGWANGQEGKHVAVLQALLQALRVKREVLHFTRCFLGGVCVGGYAL